MDKWELVTKFRNLVEAGLVQMITCPDCGKPTLFRIDEEDEPYVYCAWDDTNLKPGSAFWQDVRAVVKEHYVE